MRFLFLVVGLYFMTACSFRDEKIKPNEFGSENSNLVNFADVNKKIFGPKCLSCHISQQPTFRSYQEIKSSIELITKKAIFEGSMPPNGPLSEDARSFLLKWINEGAPETLANKVVAPAPAPAPQSSTTVTTWSRVRAEVFEPKCFNCHFKGNKNALSDLTSVVTMRETMNTVLFLTQVNPQMPPPPDSLTQAQKKIISDWVIDGMRDDTVTSRVPNPIPIPIPVLTAAPSPTPTPAIVPNPTPVPVFF